jgi:hypothetical protein
LASISRRHDVASTETLPGVCQHDLACLFSGLCGSKTISREISLVWLALATNLPNPLEMSAARSKKIIIEDVKFFRH